MPNFKTISDAMLPGLKGVGLNGQLTQQMAGVLATGLTKWVQQIVVQTTDQGRGGKSKCVRTPLAIRASVLFFNLLLADGAGSIFGGASARMTRGTANGLAAAFSKMRLNTHHPNVGSGTGRATFQAPPAGPFLIRGLTAIGLAVKGKSIGLGLDRTFASLVIPVSIVGAAEPYPGAGAGTGSII